jgi:carboxypeptidase D
MAETCGYSDYMSQHLKYPPNGPLPLPGNSVVADSSCDVWDAIFNAALMINPAFNIYRIFDMVSSL